MLFLLSGLYLASIAPSIEIAWVVGILLATVFLFVFELVPIDIAAISVMVFLGITSLIAPLMGLTSGLADINKLFIGFSSNAVMSIIAVMIIGAGLDKTGIMNSAAKYMMRLGGTTEKKIIPLISGSVGVISGFMQNVGAAALFLPVVGRISARSSISISRLLMPMGFCAILGGTLTLVGSSPLILLNDLIANSNSHLGPDQQMRTFGLFSVTPIGIAMILTGIAYFVLVGRYILPHTMEKHSEASSSTEYFKETYGLDYAIREMRVPYASPLIGRTLDEFETKYRVRTIAVTSGKHLRMGPGGLLLDMKIEEGDIVAWIGEVEALDAFAREMELIVRPKFDHFADALSPLHSGLAEIVVTPTSPMVGESARDLGMRSGHGVSTLAIIRSDGTVREGQDVRSIPFEAGDTVVVYTDWDSLQRLHVIKNYVVVTSEYPHEEVRVHKAWHAGAFLVIALSLILFTELRLSVSLLVGALGMILTKVLTAEEAYYSVSWKTVFLLASLIPLGATVEATGTAAWIADGLLHAIGHPPIWVLQLTVAILATLFTLVMSNVGATVLLVPLAVNIALTSGADPAVFALTVAIATSNSFILPTHQVNALIMGPGRYKVIDFVRAGGVMTILFLVVLMLMMNIMF
ncbi:MAG: SLC13 family permease [Gammaproteobacteria bacterium]|nr:SLC13 family permease [Gammaproteobacteria bacterium]